MPTAAGRRHPQQYHSPQQVKEVSIDLCLSFSFTCSTRLILKTRHLQRRWLCLFTWLLSKYWGGFPWVWVDKPTELLCHLPFLPHEGIYLEFILCSYYIIRSTSDDHRFAWELLSVIASGENMDLRRYLSRVMEHWSKAKKLTPVLVKALCSHTEDKDHLQVRQMSWMDGSI